TVAADLDNNRWHSTQTTAYALLAIGKFGHQGTGENRFSYTFDGRSTTVTASAYLHRIPVDISSGPKELRVQNTDDRKLDVRVVREAQLPPGANPPVQNDNNLLTMNVRYTDRDGADMDPGMIRQGTDFIAEVTLKNTGNIGTYERMALAQLFPSGWEIINT